MEAGVLVGGVLVPDVLHLAALLVPALAEYVHPNPLLKPPNVFIPGRRQMLVTMIRPMIIECPHLPLCAEQWETNQTIGAVTVALCSLKYG